MPKSSSAQQSPTFTGFGPQALGFLRALAFHQTKEWFEENRLLYETDLKLPLQGLVRDLSREFERLGVPLRGDGRSVFRLHRDIRFSKDKRPYKTNAGAVLSRDGTKRAQGFLYIHIDPEECFTAAGFWHPEPDEMLALRGAMVAKPKPFRDALKKLEKAGLGLGDGDPLARAPKGFEEVTEPDLATAVRMRNIIVRRPIDPDRICSADLVGDLVTFTNDAEPLLRLGWAALDAHRPA